MKVIALLLLVALVCVSAVVVPFTSCGSSIMTIKSLEGSNWPPRVGEQFVLSTSLDSPVEVTSGSFEILSKFSGITVDTQKGSLCEFGDVKCPMQAGDVTIVNEGVFPANAPSGSYAMRTLIKDGAGNQLFCYVVNFDV